MAFKNINEYYTLIYSTHENYSNVIYFKTMIELRDFVNILTSSFGYVGTETLSLIVKRKIVRINKDTNEVDITSEDIDL